MRRWSCALIAVALLLAITGCGLETGATSPQEAVRQDMALHPRFGNVHLQFLGIRNTPDGAIVLYSFLTHLPGQIAPTRLFGYQHVQHVGFKWVARSGAANDISTSPSPGTRVCYTTDVGSDTSGYYSVIYGRVLAPDVDAIEVTFSNRRIGRDQITNNVFAIFLSEATTAQNLRLYGKDGRELVELNLPLIVPGTSTQAPGPAVSGCS